MKKLLVLSLLLGFSVPVIAHNEFNGGEGGHRGHDGGELYSAEKESADLTGGEKVCLGPNAELVPC